MTLRRLLLPFIVTFEIIASPLSADGKTMNPDPAIQAFQARRDAALQDLFKFLRFQTISAQPEHKPDLQACAEWIREQLTAAGLPAQVVKTAGHPVVLADSGPVPGGKRTLLFYGHYDVQPPGDLALWTSPPFDPQIREGAIYARGSADDKGQVMCHLAAMRAWHQTGQLWPVRIKFLIEGEEEVGSPNLPDLVRGRRDQLACDDVVLSDTGKLTNDIPAIGCASRGLVYKQLTIEGPKKDVHSGQYGGTIANPANVLAAIIASLHDARGRVTVPGFYDDVLPLTPEERRALNAHGMSDVQLLKETGSPAPAGEEGFTTIERCTVRPTLDVNGLISGYTGQGGSTIIPAWARVKLTMRLVPRQDPEKISQAFDEAVRKACPPTVRLTIESSPGRAAYLAPTDSPAIRAAAKALEQGYGRPAVLTREGGTLPILPLFKEVLGADSVMIGFAAPDCNLHSPNEFFHLRDFEIGTACILRFLADMGHGG